MCRVKREINKILKKIKRKEKKSSDKLLETAIDAIWFVFCLVDILKQQIKLT